MEVELQTGTSGVGLPPFKPLPFKLPDLSVERRPDGTILLRSNHQPGPSARSMGHMFAQRALQYPDRFLIRQRYPADGPWRGYTYRQAKQAADSIAQWLVEADFGPKDPVMVLSGNSLEHALLMLGCYTAGVPIAPISTAYSLVSTDHGKLRHCFAALRPKAVFAQDGASFERAFSALRSLQPDLKLITVDGTGGTIPFGQLLATPPGRDVETAMDRIGDATVAKFLFTSGSTGMPKCVPQTHGMFTASMAGRDGMSSGIDFGEEGPNYLEWMPWSHVSAGNMIFNSVLSDAGTLYIDEGRPLPGKFETTIANLSEVSPAIFGSAPIAMAMLADAMERDVNLRRAFFKNLIYMGYGGATLSNDLYDRLQALAIAETGLRLPLMTMYGSTETQAVTMVHWLAERAGLVGLPMPGMTLKLVPNGGKLEIRVKGPTVMSGYHGSAKGEDEPFDEEGFYKLGDAVRFIDPEDPVQGLAFDGRITEDFKLNTGSWVSVGTLRPELIAACSPLVQDMIITGQDKHFVGALIWPSPTALAELGRDRFISGLEQRLRRFNTEATGSSRRIGCFAVLADPPSIDTGEVTDKGYVNQRAALEWHKSSVDALYSDPPGTGVVRL